MTFARSRSGSFRASTSTGRAGRSYPRPAISRTASDSDRIALNSAGGVLVSAAGTDVPNSRSAAEIAARVGPEERAVTSAPNRIVQIVVLSGRTLLVTGCATLAWV